MRKRETVGIRHLKNQASRIVNEVRERDVDYVVTKRGEPVAVIRPWRKEDAREKREFEARSALSRLAEVAERVARAAERASGGAGAVSAVSEQRR